MINHRSTSGRQDLCLTCQNVDKEKESGLHVFKTVQRSVFDSRNYLVYQPSNQLTNQPDGAECLSRM